MIKHMLTTKDNPFNPFTQNDEWTAWDERSGYNTNSYLARIIKTSDELSEADQDQAIEDAIDEIIEEDFLDLYIKVPEPQD